MPTTQRGFLYKLASSQFSLRLMAISASQATSSPVAHELVTKYNNAVCTLRRFRDAHLKIAGIYVVAQARKAAIEAGRKVDVLPPVTGGSGGGAIAATGSCPVGAMLRRMAEEGDADLLAVCPVSGLGLGLDVSKSSPSPSSSCAVKGTGGTELVGMLRGNRDSTTSAMIPVRRS